MVGRRLTTDFKVLSDGRIISREIDWGSLWPLTTALPQPRSHFLMTRCVVCWCTRKDHVRDGACRRCPCEAMRRPLGPPPAPQAWANAQREMVALLGVVCRDA